MNILDFFIQVHWIWKLLILGLIGNITYNFFKTIIYIIALFNGYDMKKYGKNSSKKEAKNE